MLAGTISKMFIELVATAGGEAVASKVITRVVTPKTTEIIGKVCVYIGGAALTSFAGDVAKSYAMKAVDKIANRNSVKHVVEVV